MTFSQIKDYSYQIVDLRSKIQEYEATKYNRVVDTVSSDRVDRENLLDINSVIDSYIDERKKITGLSKIKYTTTGNNYDCLPYTVIDLKEVVDGAFLKPGNLFYHTVDGWDSLDVTNPDPILDPNLHASYETWGTDTVISGNIAYWNMDAVSNIPNEPTGVAYEWNKVDTSGWVASNCILTFSGGVLVNTITNSSNNIKRTVTSFVGTNFKTVKIRLRQTSGTLSGSFSFFGNEPAIRKDVTYTSPRLGEWKIVDIDMTTPTAGAWIGTSISNITIAFSASSGVYEISDIYVGNGAYSTGSLADNSGNGNHGTIYGATPVAGISGKALAFDGVNDYVENGYQDSTAYTLSAWIKRVGSGSAAQDIMYLNRSASGGRLILRILSNAITAICVDAALASKTITGPTVGESWTHLTVTHSGATMALYVNGDLVQSLATTLTSVYYNILRLGSQGAASGFFFSGTIDEPRIYNRALSAEEVYSLYHNKAGGPDCQVKSVTPVANSLMVRDASGITGVNGIKFPGTQAPSSDQNTLDDYEEGTFTPGITFGGASVGVAYTTQFGRYTKIGNRVFFEVSIVIAGKGSSTGNAKIAGLPFLSANYVDSRSQCSLRFVAITYTGYPNGTVFGNSNAVDLYESTEAGIFSSITDVDFTAAPAVNASGHYTV